MFGSAASPIFYLDNPLPNSGSVAITKEKTQAHQRLLGLLRGSLKKVQQKQNPKEKNKHPVYHLPLSVHGELRSHLTISSPLLSEGVRTHITDEL